MNNDEKLSAVQKYIGMKFEERRGDLELFVAEADKLEYPKLSQQNGYRGLFSAIKCGDFGLEFNVQHNRSSDDSPDKVFYTDYWYSPYLREFASRIKEPTNDEVQRVIAEYYKKHTFDKIIKDRENNYFQLLIVLDLALALSLDQISRQDAIGILENYNSFKILEREFLEVDSKSNQKSKQ